MHVARRVAISTRAINARWSNIATLHAKRNIDQSIRKHVRDELQSYMMNNYSKSILLKKIVQYAFYPCDWIRVKALFNHVVVNSSVMDVFMRCGRKQLGEGK